MQEGLRTLLRLDFEGLPPSANLMYRSNHSSRYKTKAVADWQEHVSLMLQEAWEKQRKITKSGGLTNSYSGRASVVIRFAENTYRRWDIDNRIKPLLDCLEMSGVLEDDSQVDHLSVTREKGPKRKTTIILLGQNEEESRYE